MQERHAVEPVPNANQHEEDGEEHEDKINDTDACKAPNALIAEDNANAEFLIGLDGSPDDEAIGKLAALRAKQNLQEKRSLQIALL